MRSIDHNLMKCVSVVLNALYRPIDASSVAVFRIGFGGILVWEVFRYFQHDWISRYYTGKQYYFTYPGFSWVSPLSEFWMHGVFVLLGVFAFLVVIGLFYRLAAPAVFFLFSYIFLLEQARYLNHFYMVILISFLMIWIPAHREWSLDSVLRRYRSKSAHSRYPVTLPYWALAILQFQVGVVYFYGGIAKLTPDWLRGYPLVHWIAGESHVPIIGPFVHEYWMALFLSYAGLLIDLFIVPLLLWRRTRVIGFVLAIAFNLLNWQLFSIGIFPWTMIASLVLFLEPETPRNAVLWLQKRLFAQKSNRKPRVSTKRPQRQFSLLQKCSLAALALYVAFQVLFPLRHWLYPGVVHWTEEGHQYAWHMKLRSKQGIATFRVRDPILAREYIVEPQTILNARQLRKMPTRPGMILQFAHFLAEKYDVLGHGMVEVYTDSVVSLNGRPYQRFIKPDVNLAAVRWSLFPANWIEPLRTSLQR